jgi:hypothetical protein
MPNMRFSEIAQIYLCFDGFSKKRGSVFGISGEKGRAQKACGAGLVWVGGQFAGGGPAVLGV